MADRENNDAGLLIARVLIGLVFLVTAYWMVKEMGDLTRFLEGRGFPAPGIAAWAVALVGAIGGLALVAGLRLRLVAIAMSAYVLGATLLVHLEPGDSLQVMHMLKNVAIIGGLVAIYSATPRTRQPTPDAP